MRDRQRRTMLHLALWCADSNRLLFHLSTEVDVSIQDVEGNMPLHVALKCYHSKVLVQIHCCHAKLRWPIHHMTVGRQLCMRQLILENANLVQAIGQIADVNVHSHS